MAFTGDLEHLPIVDIIQLVHTTRKSGIFSVKSDKGESNIVFSSGYIVGANHINDSIRIGSVLVKMGAITPDDLKQAVTATKDAGTDHRPLLSALVHAGKLKQDDALKGLKKLVEMTIVELMSWTRGTFTFDTEASVFAAESADPSGDVGQDVVLDAQMVLMDALRVFDERERDRSNGKEVPSFEALYPEVLPGEHRTVPEAGHAAITADVLGLADIDHLEKKIPRPASEMEIFDPVAIHRQKISELLAGFSAQEQEAFVSFLRTSMERKPAPGAAAQQAGKAVILFSSDTLIRHSVMTITKEERIPVFATEDENDLDRIVAQCLASARTPLLVFDVPPQGESGLPDDAILELRRRTLKKYPMIPLLQLAPLQDSGFILQSYHDGVRAVIPKPLKEVQRETYVHDTIQFLGSFTSYIRSFQDRPDSMGRYVKELKKEIRALREIKTPSDAALVMLAALAELFERAVTFIVGPTELTGERSVGVSTEKSIGPVPADRLKVPLDAPSVFREVIEKGTTFYGENSGEAVTAFFQMIGAPLRPSFILIPLISDRKVVAVVYGDFGNTEVSQVQLDILEILAQQVGISLEYALFRRQVSKSSLKP